MVVTVALVLNARSEVLRSQTLPDAPVTGLALEHSAPMTLTLRVSVGKREGIAELTTRGSEIAAISIPSSWERREVRGAALETVTAEPATMGFTRWHVPPGVTVSFRVNEMSGLIIRNPSGIPLLIIGKRVNVMTGEVEEKSILMKDGATQLW